LNFRKTIILFVVLIIGLIIVRFSLRTYLFPYINFSALLLLSIYLWGAIKVRINKRSLLLRIIFTLLFWLPLLIVFIASILLLFTTLDDWPSFLRVYFVGGLFAYIFSLVLPVIFLFISDIIRWIQLFFLSKKHNTKRVNKLDGKPVSRKKFIVNTGLSLGGLALGTMGFGMLHGNYHFKIWHHRLQLKRLPLALKGLKIIQISDLHLGTWVSKEPLNEAIGYMNSLDADLVFFTGDLVNAKTEEAFDFYSNLERIKSKLGIYVSLGNHDYGHYHHWNSKEEEDANWNDLLDFYKNLGWQLLRNENDILNINGAIVQVIGVENWSLNPRFPQIGDLDKAFNKNAIADINLLLSHDPTHWDEKVKKFSNSIDITFSGHTHGFQFGIESAWFRWSPAQYVYKHWAGIYYDEKEDRYLNVNRGIGAIGFPGRVGIRPEITLIELV